MEKTQITCPECRNQFDAEEALTHHLKHKIKEEKKLLQEQMRNWKTKQEQQMLDKDAEIKKQAEKLKQQELELETRVTRLVAGKEAAIQEHYKQKEAEQLQLLRKKAEQENLQAITSLKEELEEKSKLVQEARGTQIQLEKLQRQLADQKQELELQYEQKRAKERRELEETISKREAESHMLKLAEKDQQLEGMRKQVNELKRKAEQGSMQLQGEVQELAIEDKLRKLFPQDNVQEVPKGLNGGDTVQKIMDDRGNACGIILYESKRTKAFSHTWLQKLRDDQQRVGAAVAVLVTEAMPEGVKEFDWIDGILVCSFSALTAVAILTRDKLIDLTHLKVAQTNQGSKMALLYNYLTSIDFKLHLEEIIRTFEFMRQQLDKEKRVFHKQWNEREKHIERVMHHTAGLYGTLRGIAGAAIREIPALELEEPSGNEQIILSSLKQ